MNGPAGIRRLLTTLTVLLALERLGPTLAFGNGFTISGGTVTVANAAGLSAVGDLLISSGSLVALNSQITIGGNWTNIGGSFSPGTSTVTLSATAAGKTITSKGSSFYNLFFNGSGGYWTLQDSMTVLSTMTMTHGTLDANTAPSRSISIGGGWLNNGGTFTANQSTVTWIGNSAQMIRNAGQAFGVVMDSNTSSGGVVFASSFTATGLIINSAGLTSAATVYFSAGSTYTVTGLTLIGASGKRVWMRSTTDGQPWYLNNTSTNAVSYVDVRDSNANAGIAIAAGPRSIDSGNNPNWTFLILSVSISPGSYDFGAVHVASTVVSGSPIAVTNTGNDTETYALSVATTGATTVWNVGVATPTTHDTFVMFGGFNSALPSSGTFTTQNVITSAMAASTNGIFALNQTGLNTPAGSNRQLWLRLDMPPTTTTIKPQQMDLTITATAP